MNKIKIVKQIFFWFFAITLIINIIPMILSLLTYIIPSLEMTLNGYFEQQSLLLSFFQYMAGLFPISVISLIVLVYGLCLKLNSKNMLLVNTSYALSFVALLIAVVVATMKGGSQSAGITFTLIYLACYLAAIIVAIVSIIKDINRLQDGDVKDDFILVPEKGQVME